MRLAPASTGKADLFQKSIQTTTVRSFDGGWNVVDNDLNMQPKYAVVLDNMERSLDGTLELRKGTALFSTLGLTQDIVNCVYFNSQTICVQDTGVVWSVNAAGVATKLQIAAADPWGGASGSVTSVSFAIFNNDLIMHDSVHKPLTIEGHPFTAAGAANPRYNVLNYLGDPAVGPYTNVNTPIGKFIVSHRQFAIVGNLSATGGKPPKPSSISISAKGIGGLYFGDAPPNDAVEIDLGPRISLGSSAITGMVSYRDKLLVAFERGVLLLNLDIYTGSPAVHTPTDDGFVEEFGSQSHRSMVSIGDDTLYCDNIGVNSITRSSVFNTLRPQRASEKIDPAITELIQPLSPTQIAQYVFAVYDMRHRRYMLFVPIMSGSTVVESVCFSYTNVPTLNVEAWARLRGWVWRSSCRTALQNIIFTRGHKLYTYDFDNETSNADMLGDAAYNGGLGVPITFDWELPWGDFNKRMNKKKSTYVSMDTTGTAAFTLSMYVDNIRVDRNAVDAPALTTELQGADVAGYGGSYYGSSPYGAGRPTGDERLLAWPADFKIAKFRVSGSTTKPLRIISLSISYQSGSIGR